MSINKRTLLGLLCVFIGITGISSAIAGAQCSPPNQQLKRTIVLIDAGTSIGSGIVIAPNRILTAAHVVADADNVEITINNFRLTATVISRQFDTDLALIEAPNLPVRPVAFATHKRIKQEWVWAMGYPFGQELVSASGQYKGIWSHALYTSASVNFGQSGGGLIACENGHHVLAGVVRAFGANKINGKLVRRDDISIATGIDEIRKFLASNQVALRHGE